MLSRLLALASLPLLVLVLVAGGLGAPVPEEVVLLAAGALSHRGLVATWVALPACAAGILVGDSLLFAVARRVGPRALELGLLRRIATPERRARVEALFDRRGDVLVFAARHMSVLRVVVFAMAGIRGMPYRRFLLWDLLGLLITAPVMFGLGYFFSAHVELVERGVARAEHWALAVGASFVLLVLLARRGWRRRAGRSGDSS